MLTVGLDIHQSGTAVCILDENGSRVKRFLHRGHPRELVGVLSGLGGPFQAALEASCGSGTLHDLLTPIAARVVVAHPGHLRLIFRSAKKNDRVDAEKLAKLLFLDEVPQVHVPGVDAGVAGADRHPRPRGGQADDGQERAAVAAALAPDPGVRGLWTRDGLAWLAALELPTPAARLRRDVLLDDLAHTDRQVRV